MLSKFFGRLVVDGTNLEILKFKAIGSEAILVESRQVDCHTFGTNM